MQFILSLFHFAEYLVSTLSYFGIFLGMVIESSCIPLPSEAIMGFSGYIVSQGQFNFWLCIIAGSLGNLTGSTIMFFLGKYGGMPFLDKYGKYIKVSHKDIAKSEKWFDKYGEFFVFIAQCLPVIRSFIAFPSGMLGIKYKKYILYSFSGIFIWCTLLTFIGMQLGANWEEISQFIKPIQNIIIGVVGLLILYYIYSHYIKPSKS